MARSTRVESGRRVFVPSRVTSESLSWGLVPRPELRPATPGRPPWRLQAPVWCLAYESEPSLHFAVAGPLSLEVAGGR